jgi:hypothetical protein
MALGATSMRNMARKGVILSGSRAETGDSNGSRGMARHVIPKNCYNRIQFSGKKSREDIVEARPRTPAELPSAD